MFSRSICLFINTIEPWLVTPTIAKYDLDNIKLVDIKEKVLYAQFELQHILVEGNCYQLSDQGMAPPRGLELVLGTNTNSHLVVRNLISIYIHLSIQSQI